MWRMNAPASLPSSLEYARIHQRPAADMMRLIEKILMRCSAPVMPMGAALLLAACGGSGSGSVPVTTVPPAPTASISASPTIVNSGGAAMLTWSSTNTTSCNASGGWTGALATGGSQSTGALAADTTYSLSCSGSGGTSTATA